MILSFLSSLKKYLNDLIQLAKGTAAKIHAHLLLIIKKIGSIELTLSGSISNLLILAIIFIVIGLIYLKLHALI